MQVIVLGVTVLGQHSYDQLIGSIVTHIQTIEPMHIFSFELRHPVILCLEKRAIPKVFALLHGFLLCGCND